MATDQIELGLGDMVFADQTDDILYVVNPPIDT